MPKDLAQTLFNSPFTHFSSYSGYPKIQFHVSDPSLCTFNQIFKTIFIICFFFQLDYFSAFSIVVYSLLAFFLRILGSWRSSKGIKWSNFAAILGKKHALKTYDQFILNANCFWGSIESNISPQFTMASIIVEVNIS